MENHPGAGTTYVFLPYTANKVEFSGDRSRGVGVLFFETVSRMDAAPEPTWTYSWRVSKSKTPTPNPT